MKKTFLLLVLAVALPLIQAQPSDGSEAIKGMMGMAAAVSSSEGDFGIFALGVSRDVETSSTGATIGGYLFRVGRLKYFFEGEFSVNPFLDSTSARDAQPHPSLLRPGRKSEFAGVSLGATFAFNESFGLFLGGGWTARSVYAADFSGREYRILDGDQFGGVGGVVGAFGRLGVKLSYNTGTKTASLGLGLRF